MMRNLKSSIAQVIEYSRGYYIQSWIEQAHYIPTGHLPILYEPDSGQGSAQIGCIVEQR